MATFSDALSPFSRDSTTAGLSPDLILRSSDSVDFHANKIFLVYVSPVFKDMLTFPAPTILGEGVDTRDGIPIVQLSEHSDTLRKLLLLCYPGALTHGSLNSLDGLHLVYRAADKYQIPGVKVTIVDTIQANFVKDHPYRVYAIACHFGLPDLAKSAARETLKDVFHPIGIQYYNASEFELVSVAALVRLHSFHSECGAAAGQVVFRHYRDSDVRMYEEDPGMANHPWWNVDGHDGECGGSICEVDLTPAKWFKKHMETVENVVRSRPNGSSVGKAVLDYTQVLGDISQCQFCSRHSPMHLSALAGTLRMEVEQSNEDKLRDWNFI